MTTRCKTAPASWRDRLLTACRRRLARLRFRKGSPHAFPDDRLHRSFQAFDAISDLVIIKGEDSRILWCNRAFREFYGMSNQELKGLLDSPIVSPDITQQYMRDDRRVFATGENHIIDAEPATRHDGTIRWVSTVKSPLNIEGYPPLLIAVCRDITEQREAAQIINAQRTQIIASAKLSALGEMAAGIAHEINNPLAIISGRVINLRTLIAKDPHNSELINKFTSDIEVTTQRIAKIVRGLRSFAREGDGDPFVMTPLRTIIDDTLALCAGRFRNHGITLTVEAIPENATIECRHVQISQIILNLLANAFDALEHASEKWISISVARNGLGYLISIKDSGHGIPPDIRDRIFHPFFTTKPVGRGTGLGLSVTKGLVECHKGSIALDPVGAHTCFLVWLPERHRA